MVATGDNVGIAWAMVIGAGAASSLGACIVFCVGLASKRMLVSSACEGLGRSCRRRAVLGATERPRVLPGADRKQCRWEPPAPSERLQSLRHASPWRAGMQPGLCGGRHDVSAGGTERPGTERAACRGPQHSPASPVACRLPLASPAPQPTTPPATFKQPLRYVVYTEVFMNKSVGGFSDAGHSGAAAAPCGQGGCATARRMLVQPAAGGPAGWVQPGRLSDLTAAHTRTPLPAARRRRLPAGHRLLLWRHRGHRPAGRSGARADALGRGAPRAARRLAPHRGRLQPGGPDQGRAVGRPWRDGPCAAGHHRAAPALLRRLWRRRQRGGHAGPQRGRRQRRRGLAGGQRRQRQRKGSRAGAHAGAGPGARPALLRPLRRLRLRRLQPAVLLRAQLRKHGGGPSSRGDCAWHGGGRGGGGAAERPSHVRPAAHGCVLCCAVLCHAVPCCAVLCHAALSGQPYAALVASEPACLCTSAAARACALPPQRPAASPPCPSLPLPGPARRRHHWAGDRAAQRARGAGHLCGRAQ